MYRIGEFSKLTNLSIRTLRYYNEIGLLIPEEVDIFTNYRYYGKNNIEQAKLIDELKKAGFSLEEIRDNWNQFTEELFVRKRKELYSEVQNFEKKIKKLDELNSHLVDGKIVKDKINKIKKI